MKILALIGLNPKAVGVEDIIEDASIISLQDGAQHEITAGNIRNDLQQAFDSADAEILDCKIIE